MTKSLPSRHLPYWVTPEMLTQLTNMCVTTPVNNPTHVDVLNELGVAQTRATALNIKMEYLTTALGLTEGSIPIFLNKEEKQYITQHPHVTETIKEKLK